MDNKVNSPTDGGSTCTNGFNIASAETDIFVENGDVVNCEMKHSALTFNISSIPPIHLTVFLAIQQCLIALPWALTIALLVCKVVCAMEDEEFIARLLSTAIFMAGICTFLQVTFGVRLPLYQGPTSAYIIPLLAIAELPDWQCPARLNVQDKTTAFTFSNDTGFSDPGNNTILISRNVSSIMKGVMSAIYRDTVITPRVVILKGSLMLAGCIHMLIGMTGTLGILLKFIGPITVIPTILLIGLNVFKVVANFCGVNWGASIPTSIIGIILSLYLGTWKMPLLVWNRKNGCHTIRFPLQQVLALLLSLVFGWIISLIFTVTGSIPDDKTGKQYYARTDARIDVIDQMPWFYVPYPGQFGGIEFSVGIFAAFLVATFVSIIDSVADYYAVARTACVPPPPMHSINRGIMVEGFMSFVAGLFGTGHATSTYGDNIGAIGVTKVASRRVFQGLGILLILMSFFGKLAAVFINIPLPVLGGVQILGFGTFLGLVMSNLQFVDMNSTRNLAIVGISVLLGLVFPFWIKENTDAISTGSTSADKMIQMLLTNSTLIGGVLACFLDNTVPGSLVDRGMIAWTSSGMDTDEGASKDYDEGLEVYEIRFLNNFLKRFQWFSYIPFMPTFNPEKTICSSQCCKRSNN